MPNYFLPKLFFSYYSYYYSLFSSYYYYYYYFGNNFWVKIICQNKFFRFADALLKFRNVLEHVDDKLLEKKMDKVTSPVKGTEKYKKENKIIKFF